MKVSTSLVFLRVVVRTRDDTGLFGGFLSELGDGLFTIEKGCGFFESTLAKKWVNPYGAGYTNGTYVFGLDEVEVDKESFEGEPADIDNLKEIDCVRITLLIKQYEWHT